MQAVILAAGRGKRLFPITANRTKAMAPIVGKPIVERVMEPLVMNGIRSFIIVASPEDCEITNHFENISTIDAEISLAIQPVPLGMGHALQQAAPYIKQDFILSSCDNLVDINEIRHLLQMWNNDSPDALLTTIHVEAIDVPRMGILDVINGRVIRIIEKPPLNEAPSNIGSVPLYVFSTSILENLGNITLSHRGEYELQDAIQDLIDRGGHVRTHQLQGRTDLTILEDLLKINRHYLINGNHKKGQHLVNFGTNNVLIPPFYIEDDVEIGSNCLIGPNIYIEHGCIIGDGCILRDLVVLRDLEITKNTIFTNRLIC